MSTLTVSKGAGRAAAARKTAKHAQRTPLPPKQKDKEIGKEIDRLLAKDSKGLFMGHSKATKLAEFAEDFGWTSVIETPAPDTVVAVLTKESEEITATWVNGIVPPEATPVYCVGERQVKLRNVSAAKKQIGSEPDAKPIQELSPGPVRRSRRGSGSLPPNLPRRRVPFDVETASDEEIIKALTGKKIRWRNMMANGKIEHGQVSRRGKQIKIERHPNRSTRTITFCDDNGGFRSVALDRLLVVGK